jgi:hypothetical protein
VDQALKVQVDQWIHLLTQVVLTSFSEKHLTYAGKGSTLPAHLSPENVNRSFEGVDHDGYEKKESFESSHGVSRFFVCANLCAGRLAESGPRAGCATERHHGAADNEKQSANHR